MKNRTVGLLVLGVVTILLAACGAQSTPEPLELTIVMTEYAFGPADLEFQVGQQVTLNLVNEGALVHEIMFGRDVMMMEGKPNGYQNDMFEMAGVEPSVMMMGASEHEEDEHSEGDEHVEDEHMEGDDHEEDEHMEGDDHEDGEDEHAHSGFMVVVPVGKDTYSMTFTVTEDMVGEWEIGCFELEGVHYTAGMVGTLTVSE